MPVTERYFSSTILPWKISLGLNLYYLLIEHHTVAKDLCLYLLILIYYKESAIAKFHTDSWLELTLSLQTKVWDMQLFHTNMMALFSKISSY